MNKIKLACGIASLALATQAFALTQTVNSGVISGSFLTGGGWTISNGSGSAGTLPSGGTASGVPIMLTVPAFSDAAHIYLQSVSYTLEVYTYGDFNFENFSNGALLHRGTWEQDNATLVAAAAGVNDTGITTPTQQVNFSNLPVGDTRVGRSSSRQDDVSGNGGSTAAYNVPVTYTFTPNLALGYVGSDDPANVKDVPPVVSIGARLIVTYTYSDVPEPSTYAAGAFLLAGAGFIARRRMMAK
jgi:hypothetical protein